MSQVSMSHSRKQVMQTCGRLYRYRYVDRLESEVVSANLVFGKAIHSAAAATVTLQALGMPLQKADTLKLFEEEWQAVTSQPVQYSSLWDEEKLRLTGLRLVELFWDDWHARGWQAILDSAGTPVVERTLKVMLPGSILYTMVIDVVVRTPEGKILVVDFKTPSAVEGEGFSDLSDQLTAYQVGVQANAKALGIERVDGVLFYDLVKRPIPKTGRGTGPHLHVPEPSLPRSNQDVEEWISEVRFVAEDIRRGRFFKRPMDAWNSPCDLCDFRALCLGRSKGEEFFVRPPRNLAVPA